jgi:DNA primase
MQTNGFPETVAPLGTALTADHLAILCKLNRNITFCFDGDKAGKKAAARAADLSMPLLRAESDIRFAFVPNGKDPDEILRDSRPEIRDSMRKIIDSAIPLVDFLWQLANENFIVATPGGRASAEKFLNTEIEKIADPDLKKEYRQEFDQRKFQKWHKWRRITDNRQPATDIPSADSIIRKTLKNILSQHPEIAEKNVEFFMSYELDPFETYESSGPRLEKATAESIIRKMKISGYIETLKKEMATATDSAKIAALNLEISKSAAALAKIDD